MEAAPSKTRLTFAVHSCPLQASFMLLLHIPSITSIIYASAAHSVHYKHNFLFPLRVLVDYIHNFLFPLDYFAIRTASVTSPSSGQWIP
jgi:hypothetical protein